MQTLASTAETQFYGPKNDAVIPVTAIYSGKVHEERGGLGGDSHTHSPTEARDQGSPLHAWGRGGDASATTQTVALPTRLPVSYLR